MSHDRDRHSTQEVSPQTLVIWAVAIAAAFGWIFWDFVQRQFRFAIEQQADWGHTLVIPFIAGYFVWLCRRQLLREPFQKAWSGLALIMFGLGWYTLCALGPTSMHHHNLMGLGVACTLTGIVLFMFGWRAMRYLWFPLLYVFVFGQTISDRFMEIITFKLQDIASIGSYWGLSILGLDVTRAGNTIEILYNNISYPLNIAEACSGMRMLMAFFALGVAMAYTSLPYLWQRTALIVFAIPTAVFVNILRVMTLGILSISDSGFAAGNFHTFVGTLWLLPAFMIYLGIVWLLKNLVIENADGIEEVEYVTSGFYFSGSAKNRFVVAISLLAISAIMLQVAVGALNIYLHKEPVFPRRDFAVIPVLIGDWTKVGEDARFDAAGVEALGTEFYLSRFYINADRTIPPLHLHIAYYTGQVDAVPHVPDRCMLAGGYESTTAEPITLELNIATMDWELDPLNTIGDDPYPIVRETDVLTGEDRVIRLPVGDFELRTSSFRHPKTGEDQIHAGYFFIANGKTTAYPGRIRLLAFDQSTRYSYYCKIQFTIRGDQDYSVEQFREEVTDFVSSLLPEIMKCLPDWVEVTTTSDPKTLSDNQES